MRWFDTSRRSARPALPIEIAAALQDGERVLAVAPLAQAEVLVATRFGLWWAVDRLARDGQDGSEVQGVGDGGKMHGVGGEVHGAGAERAGRPAVRWDWHRISRAGFAGGALTLTLAQQIEPPVAASADPSGLGTGAAQVDQDSTARQHGWPDGLELLVDLPPRPFRLAASSALTDAVHARVRGSVVASEYLPFAGAGGWLVWRRVAGRDGLTPQVRLDRGADPGAAGFAAAVAAGLEALRGRAEVAPPE